MLVAPALWVALEWVRAQALSGFPWASLGYSQYLNRPLIQVAEFTSVYGVSFALVLGNVVIAQLFYVHRASRVEARGMLPCALAHVQPGSDVGLWGVAPASDVQPQHGAGRPGSGLATGNIEQDLKWDRASQEAIFSIYRGLTLEAAADPAVELIVWPEAATPFFFANDRVFQARQLRLAQEAGRPLLFGSPTYAPRWRPRRHVQ